MKAHEKLDLTKEYDYYKKYEPEYYGYLWSCIEDVFKHIKLIEEDYEDLTSNRAAQYFVASLLEQNEGLKEMQGRYIVGNTPIERLFYECFNYICWKEKIKIYLVPQFLIETNGKKYYVDFLASCELVDKEKARKYVIECDGFDYHSSKKQQAYDNQRQRDIENAGYTIIRFSGKEIYDDEVKCVYEALKRIDVEVKE